MTEPRPFAEPFRHRAAHRLRAGWMAARLPVLLAALLVLAGGCSEYDKQIELAHLMPVLLLQRSPRPEPTTTPPSPPTTPPATATCDQATASGGQGVTTTTHAMGSSSGTFTFSYEAYTIPDRFQVYHDSVLIYDTGVISGSGSINLILNGTSTSVVVTVTGDQSGTAWDYTVGCPI